MLVNQDKTLALKWLTSCLLVAWIVTMICQHGMLWIGQGATKLSNIDYADWCFLLLQSERGPLLKAGSLPIGWLTFYNQTVPLDKRWHILGLGYESGVPRAEIDRAAVIHFDGIMKPWLEIGISKYKGYWGRYLSFDHPHLQQCNIHE